MPIRRSLAGIEATSRPPMAIVPPSSPTSPATARSNVVFPEPDGPRTAHVTRSET